MNLEIMNLMLNENAIQFFRGIRNIFNEKWLFTGQGSADRDGYGPRWFRAGSLGGPFIPEKGLEIEIREKQGSKVIIKALGK